MRRRGEEAEKRGGRDEKAESRRDEKAVRRVLLSSRLFCSLPSLFFSSPALCLLSYSCLRREKRAEEMRRRILLTVFSSLKSL